MHILGYPKAIDKSVKTPPIVFLNMIIFVHS